VEISEIMNTWIFIVFGMVLLAALLLDLGLISKKGSTITMSKALVQTLMWVALAMAFAGFLWYEKGSRIGAQYVSAYLMEWSLSVDNIFVFILLFRAFGVKQQYYARVLLIGILMAIVFRILFITFGIAIVTAVHWVLYIFGAFLLYTGFTMFFAKEKSTFNPEENKVYRFLKKYLPLTDQESGGKLLLKINGKTYFTTLAVVIIVLATTDIVFALDSIPAVLAISRDPLVVYTSNIFAVLGLRSLFFLLRGAIDRFKYLQQGIAIILVFIGAKMLADIWHVHLEEWISLAVIVGCLGGSILYSLYKTKTSVQ
jgi:tellurite resistance protein TerC